MCVVFRHINPPRKTQQAFVIKLKNKIKTTEESQKTKREEPKEKLRVDSNGAMFKFNAYAPEFVRRSRPQMVPVSAYYYPFFHYLNGSGGEGGFDWFFVGEQEQEPIAATYS